MVAGCIDIVLDFRLPYKLEVKLAIKPGVTSDKNGNAYVSCVSAHAVLLVLGGRKKIQSIGKESIVYA